VRGTATFNAKARRARAQVGHLFEVPKISAGYPLDEVEWPLFRTLAGTSFKTTGAERLRIGTPTLLKARQWVRADFGADNTGFPACARRRAWRRACCSCSTKSSWTGR